MRSFLLLSALSAALLPAVPLTITEPPDMPDTGGLTYTVDVGTNTVSGSVNGSPGIGPDFADNFSIFVPGNLLVTSTFVSITSFANGGSGALGCFTGAGCFGTGLGSGLNNPASGATVSYTAESPWANDGGGGVILGSYNWTLTLQVTQSTQPQAVPEPGTMALVLPLLAGAWSLRRRSR